MVKRTLRLVAAMLIGMAGAGEGIAQGQRPAAPSAPVTGPGIEKIKVHGRSLEGNLEGNSADRDVFVVLPPSYATAKNKRYPVVYFLHGFSLTAEGFIRFGNFAQAARDAQVPGKEFIVVFPDSDTKQGGAMYSTSATVGDFEGFVARDLVAYVDSHYRTVAERASRGLAGHSMGGYGTFRIGMKNPQVFSTIYAMSACCLAVTPMSAEQGRALEAITPEQAPKTNFGNRAMLASAAAWSPAPGKAPMYLDLPTKDGILQPEVIAQWQANAPLAMAPQYVAGLKTMTAISFDVGDKDTLAGSNQAMHALFDRFGLRHGWELYEGDHVNRIAARFKDKVMPFFAANLKQK